MGDKYIAKLSDGTLVFFPAGVGKSVGYDIARATPIKHPRWNLQVHHEDRVFHGIPVTNEFISYELLKLPRMKH